VRSRISRSCRATAPRIRWSSRPAGRRAWQSRKARIKQRIREIAHQLIRIAAERQVRPGEVMRRPRASTTILRRFPYAETEDQTRAIEEVLGDLAAAGRWTG